MTSATNVSVFSRGTSDGELNNCCAIIAEPEVWLDLDIDKITGFKVTLTLQDSIVSFVNERAAYDPDECKLNTAVLCRE